MQVTPTPRASEGCAHPPTPPPPVPPWVAEKASRRTPELPFRDPGAGPAAFWLEAESWWLSAPGSLMADDGSQKGQGPRCLSGPQPLQVPSGLAEPRAGSPEHPTPAPFSPEDRRGLRAPGVALGRLLSRTEDLVQFRTVSSVLLGKRGEMWPGPGPVSGPCGPHCSLVSHSALSVLKFIIVFEQKACVSFCTEPRTGGCRACWCRALGHSECPLAHL